MLPPDLNVLIYAHSEDVVAEHAEYVPQQVVPLPGMVSVQA